MLSNITLFVAASFAVLVAASPVPGGSSNGPHCNTGPVQCCNQVHEAKSESGAALLSLIGVAGQGVTGQVFAQCSPITAVGLGGGSHCSSTPVCCSNNSFNGLVVIGCSPVNLGL